MAHLLLALALLGSGKGAVTFTIQTELQGLYDEISQANLEFVTPADIDDFQQVLYTGDFTVTGADGQKRAWPELREAAVTALPDPPEWIQQSIRKVTPDADGATVVVSMATLRTVVSDGGHPGASPASHAVTQTTIFRDRWVKVSGAWKLLSREQVGKPTTEIDKTEE